MCILLEDTRRPPERPIQYTRVSDRRTLESTAAAVLLHVVGEELTSLRQALRHYGGAVASTLLAALALALAATLLLAALALAATLLLLAALALAAALLLLAALALAAALLAALALAAALLAALLTAPTGPT